MLISSLWLAVFLTSVLPYWWGWASSNCSIVNSDGLNVNFLCFVRNVQVCQRAVLQNPHQTLRFGGFPQLIEHTLVSTQPFLHELLGNYWWLRLLIDLWKQAFSSAQRLGLHFVVEFGSFTGWLSWLLLVYLWLHLHLVLWLWFRELLSLSQQALPRCLDVCQIEFAELLSHHCYRRACQR